MLHCKGRPSIIHPCRIILPGAECLASTRTVGSPQVVPQSPRKYYHDNDDKDEDRREKAAYSPLTICSLTKVQSRTVDFSRSPYE